jgi:hypothetical protein
MNNYNGRKEPTRNRLDLRLTGRGTLEARCYFKNDFGMWVPTCQWNILLCSYQVISYSTTGTLNFFSEIQVPFKNFKNSST